jgi:hypothetical protein
VHGLESRKTNFLWQAIQDSIFSVASADFEGGSDGRGCGVRHFFGQIGPTQPQEKVPLKNKETKLLALVSGHGRHVADAPERTLLPVGKWPLHTTRVTANL